MWSFALAIALFAASPIHALAQGGSPEQAVYQAVLAPLIQPETQRLILSDSTLTYSIGADEAAWLRRQAPALSAELLDDFRRQNARSVPLSDSLLLPVPVERVTKARLRSLAPGSNPDQWWVAFYRRFPASPGLIQLSRVGFSPDGTHGLVYMHHGCGGRCGSGAFFLLRREGGEWRIEEQIISVMI